MITLSQDQIQEIKQDYTICVAQKGSPARGVTINTLHKVVGINKANKALERAELNMGDNLTVRDRTGLRIYFCRK